MAEINERRYNVRHPSDNGTVGEDEDARAGQLNNILNEMYFIIENAGGNLPEEEEVKPPSKFSKSWKATQKVTGKALNVTLGRCRSLKTRVRNWCSELWYEIRRKEESDRELFDVQASNLVAFEQYLRHLTPFQRDVDAIVRAKFNIPKMSNRAANDAAIHTFLYRHFTTTCPTMRHTDVATHISEAIARSYIPTPGESSIVNTARDKVYQAINENYHSEINIIDYVDERKIRKSTRIYRLFFGKPVDVNLLKQRLALAKRHNPQYHSIEFNDNEVETPEKFGELDPLYTPKKPDPVDEEEVLTEQPVTQDVVVPEVTIEKVVKARQTKKRARAKGRKKPGKAKDINHVPSGEVTTLEQS